MTTATTTATAQPYQARQCKECAVWIFTDKAPFAENDRTKTMRDGIHRQTHHDDGGIFPYMSYNTETVTAIVEGVTTV